MGGMAALIPSRTDPEANERRDRRGRAPTSEREAGDGFDGTWVAHPDVVGGRRRRRSTRCSASGPTRSSRLRDDVTVDAGGAARRRRHAGRGHRGGPAQQRQRRLPVHLVLARRPRRGRHQQHDGGRGHRRDLAQSQIWQWIHTGATLDDGTAIDRELVTRILDEEMARIRRPRSEERPGERGRPEETRRVFEEVALGDEFPDFLTEVAYELLD